MLQAVVLVSAAAMLAALREPALYQASATVLVEAETLPANLEGVPDPTQINGRRIGPPVLRVGDAIAVSSEVDALAVMARLNVARGPMLDDLGRVIRSSPAAKLGVIVAGANLERRYGYLTSPYPASASRQTPETTTSPPA